MTRTRFQTLEQVVSDALFPRVDLALREGRHFDVSDVEEWSFLVDGGNILNEFYTRYHCTLTQSSDGYWFLLPEGDLVPVRRLRVADMIIGQALALLLLDPGILETRGVLPRSRVLQTIAQLVGEAELAKLLLDKPIPKDPAIAAERVREQVTRSLRSLAALGFIQLLGDESLLMRPSTLRFAEPARLAPTVEEGLRILIARGAIELRGGDDDG